MSRSLSSGMQAVSTADVVRPIFLVRMVFDQNIAAGTFVTGHKYKIVSLGDTDFTAIGASANTVGVIFTATGAGSGSGIASESPAELNLWSGVGDLTYDSETYTGVGDLLNISAVTETSDMQASGINVTLTGVKSSLVVIAKDHEYQGRAITVMLGAFDASGDLVADPTVIFAGFMDTMTISESGQTSTISIACENKLIAFERAKVRRYTAEDQKIDYPLKLANGDPNPNYDAGFEFVTAIQNKDIIWGRATGTSNGHYDDGGSYDGGSYEDR